MNCFHFSVSLGYKTTQPDNYVFIAKLWIAFIFQYLWDTKQPLTLALQCLYCCELLSFFSIFGIQNNMVELYNAKTNVVNCFHFSVSLGYKTTATVQKDLKGVLWIAFIFQYLWDTKQHAVSHGVPSHGCELLSFFSIFGIQNNGISEIDIINYVVNCFHFSVSLGYKTTTINNSFFFATLWIAFIFQYLWDTKQRKWSNERVVWGCELLSFFSIFGIQNNVCFLKVRHILVVNCFHFSVSLGYKTTSIAMIIFT